MLKRDHGGDRVAFVQFHDADALRRAAKRPNLADRDANDLTFFGNHDYFVFFEIARENFRADDVARLWRYLRRLYAASASSLHLIFAYGRVLAITLTHHYEECGIFLGGGGNDF